MIIDKFFEVKGTKLIKYNGTDDNVIIPDAITEICEKAFSSITVRSISFGPNIKKIEAGSFGFSGNYIDTVIFYGDISDWLKIKFETHFSENNTLIISGKLLSTLIIPNDCESISNYAFYGCKSLKSVTISGSVTSIGKQAFSYCSSLQKIDTSVDNKKYKTIKEGLLDNTSKTLLWGSPSTNSISDKVRIIGAYSYVGSTIKNLSVSSRISIVGECAFADCKELERVEFLSGEKSSESLEIKEYAFSGCFLLKDIILPLNLKYIGEYAFEKCENLNVVSLPEGLDTIEYTAFDDVDLEKLVFPKSITYHGFYDDPFGGGTHIEKLCYRGSEDDWDRIETCEYGEDEEGSMRDFDEFYDEIIFDYADIHEEIELTGADFEGIVFSGTLASIGDLSVQFDCDEECCSVGFGSIFNNSNKDVRVWVKDIGIVNLNDEEDIITEYKHICTLKKGMMGEGEFSVADTDFNSIYLSPFFAENNPYDECDCCWGLFFTLVFDFGDHDIECCKIMIQAQGIEVIGEYNERDTEDDYVPDPNNFTPQDILYIYKGNIRCHRYGHHIIQATAVLHNKTDNEIELNVEYCTDCKKFILEYTVFEQYRNRYGALVGNFRMVVNGEFDGEYDLAEESPLMLSGYNVSQRDGYTSQERHYILARIIHDGIMDKGDVIRYLSYFIRKNGAKRGNELALSKWEEDLAFVQEYDKRTQPSVVISEIKKY